jgi:GT2 family glycosyltransferase
VLEAQETQPLPALGSGTVEKKVTIVILTWNGLNYTRRCLATLREHTDLSAHEVIVVDNGSADGTVEFLGSLDWIRVIRNKRNLGFVKGNNLGIAASDPKSDLLLLNNDVEIHQFGWLEKLQAAAYSESRIGIVGCRLVEPGGKLLHVGTYMPLNSFWGQQIGSGEKNVNQYNRTREVEGVVFACVYIKREVLEAVGPLDEAYVSYFEDTDYCLTARQHGYKTVCCGDVTLTHHERVSTTENRVDFSSIFERSQQVFKKRWKQALESRYTTEVGWHSIMNFPTGYGTTCRNLVLALDDLAVKVAYRYVYGAGTPFPVEEPDGSDDYRLNVIRQRKIDPRTPQVVYAQGDVFEKNSGSYKIGYTMLEVEGFPREWVRQANSMDEVWVPSGFNRETFRASGLDRPIHVMPLGIDPHHFNPGITGFPLPECFTFLSVFEWGERKAPEILLKAFNDEFSATEPVVLLCKVTNIDPQVNIPAQVRNMRLDPNGGRIHFIHNRTIAPHQLGSLYRSADCFVLASRGEGWGMPILEAMACGLPAIATDWSGPTEFLTPENAYPLSVRRMIPAVAKCPYYDGFLWADPDLDHLRTLLRHVFEHQEEAREKGMRASSEVLERWTWAKAAERIKNRLQEIGGPTSCSEA